MTMTMTMTTSEDVQAFRLGGGDHQKVYIYTKTEGEYNVVYWEEVLKEFNHAIYATNNGAMVNFIADENHNMLMPQRIISKPGSVYDIVLDESEVGQRGHIRNTFKTKHQQLHSIDTASTISDTSYITSSSLVSSPASSPNGSISSPAHSSPRRLYQIEPGSFARSSDSSGEFNIVIGINADEPRSSSSSIRSSNSGVLSSSSSISGSMASFQSRMESQPRHHQRTETNNTEVQDEDLGELMNDSRSVEAQTEQMIQLLQQSISRMTSDLEERSIRRRASSEGLALDGNQMNEADESWTVRPLQLMLQSINSTRYPGSHDKEARMAYNRVMMEQIRQMFEIMRGLEGHFELAQELARSNVELQMSLVKAQHALEQDQRELNRLTHRMMEVTNKIKRSIETVFARKYEYRHSKAPRLFVILPELGKSEEEPGWRLLGRYQLFYFCECGTHTMGDKNSENHYVHISDHEGYSIKMAADFIRKFGLYILTMLNMFKFGYSSKEFKVLSLEEMEPVHRQHIRKSLKLPEGATISRAVDMMIEFLKEKLDIEDSHGINPSSSVDLEFDQLQKALDTYHSSTIQRSKLSLKGNLVRHVESGGYCSWICHHHLLRHLGLERHEQMRRSVELITQNDGSYHNESGHVTYKVENKSQMKSFIEAINNAHGVHNLSLTIDYNVPNGEIISSAKAILKSRIVHVTIKGGGLKKNLLDMFQRQSRFNALMSMLTSSTLQHLSIDDVEDFFENVSISSDLKNRYPRLSVLVINCILDCNSRKAIKVVSDIVKQCTKLTELKLISNGAGNLCSRLIEGTKDFLDFRHMKIEADKESNQRRLTLSLIFLREENGTNAPSEVKIMIGVFLEDDQAVAHQFYWMLEKFGNKVKSLEVCYTKLFSVSKMLSAFVLLWDESIVSDIHLDLGPITHENFEIILPSLVRYSKLENLALSIKFTGENQQLESFVTLLERFKDVLTKLTLYIGSYGHRINRLQGVFPDRSVFPKLETFKVVCDRQKNLDSRYACWIRAIASRCEHQTLKRLELSVFLFPVDWNDIIESLDFEILEELRFGPSNFGMEGFKCLSTALPCEVDQIVRLKAIYLGGTPLSNHSGAHRDEIEKVIKKKRRCKVTIDEDRY